MHGKIIQAEIKVGENKFEVPKGSKVLGVKIDKLKGKPVLFVLSDTKNKGETEKIKISTYCSNSDARVKNGKYIDTYQLLPSGNFYHVFQDK